MGIVWENMTPSTELPLNFYAGIALCLFPLLLNSLIFTVVYQMCDKIPLYTLCLEFPIPVVFHMICRVHRVCWCFVCYLVSTIPPIWLLELDKLEDFEGYANRSFLDKNVSFAGVSDGS